MARNHLISYPTPPNLYFAWGFGSLLGVMLVLQILTGLLLATNYIPHIDFAFDSVERIMRDVPGGWFIRYAHANGASFLFFLLYGHMARVMYFESYKAPRIWVWSTGVILFLLMAATAFLGYVLPWGQMSFWGATVITNIITTIPSGEFILIWLWGGYAISMWTLTRFYVLHFILPFIIAGLSVIHILLLHSVGSTSPRGGDTVEVTHFFPLFLHKDLSAVFTLLTIYLGVILLCPNFFGHPINYVRADPLLTPVHIVPEWYFLPFYAILKAFPSKVGGAVAMAGSLVILFYLPIADRSPLRESGVGKPWRLGVFLAFIFCVLALGYLGGQVTSDANTLYLRIASAAYFAHFLLVLPVLSWWESRIGPFQTRVGVSISRKVPAR